MSEIDLRERYAWKRVVAPKTWRPTTEGEELVGFYGGRTVLNGKYGQFEAVIIHVPHRGSFTVTGTQIIQAIDASAIAERWPIRVVWRGLVDIRTPEGEDQRRMKRFEVFVAEGGPLVEGMMPELAQ